ncbi:cupin domain-containing protein [Portibacter lacus]|uniref:Cupin n=1 Tax=Portibacter lacus TaxID=1099794 RepID=A0AA37WIA5_9BACT|nr:hypothetical protein [Portibacter lacus]GLR19500.1 hypothetical protein GCM10007940_41160 [Portibacter lacus]
MNTASLLNNLEFSDKHPKISVLLETERSKELRITFKKGQVMKKHKTPFPIVIEIFDGEIAFGAEDKVTIVKRGDMLSLDGGIPHDLTANEESIVRLTLSKGDKVERVENVANS